MTSLKQSDISVGDVVYCLEMIYYQGKIGADLCKYTIVSIHELYVGMHQFGDTSGEIYSTGCYGNGTFCDIIGMYHNIDDAHLNAIEYNETNNPPLGSKLRTEYKKIKKIKKLIDKI